MGGFLSVHPLHWAEQGGRYVKAGVDAGGQAIVSGYDALRDVRRRVLGWEACNREFMDAISAFMLTDGGAAAEDAGPLAGRDALGRFTGAGGYGAEAEAQGLAEYELATGRTVIRNQVRAILGDGGAGRYYDGLVRNADGTYIGIEVKSGSASLTARQRAFDNAINSGAIARATLDGQRIEITSTDLVRVR